MISVFFQSKLVLPARLFESQGVELKVGLLNQAAPRPGPHPELDPDIVAALDEDFDFADPNNQLEDDFILKANAVDSVTELRQIEEKSDSDTDSTGSVSDSGEDSEEFDEEETKSRFTNYSITSSVMRRSKGLQQVDAMFEKVYCRYLSIVSKKFENLFLALRTIRRPRVGRFGYCRRRNPRIFRSRRRSNDATYRRIRRG